MSAIMPLLVLDPPYAWICTSAQDREVAVARNVLPARRDEVEPELPGYRFSRQHYENALRIDAEMLIGVARELLYQPDEGADPYDTPVIRQRRQEASRAVLNVVSEAPT
jgi:hypothetical protein